MALNAITSVWGLTPFLITSKISFAHLLCKVGEIKKLEPYTTHLEDENRQLQLDDHFN